MLAFLLARGLLDEDAVGSMLTWKHAGLFSLRYLLVVLALDTRRVVHCARSRG